MKTPYWSLPANAITAMDSSEVQNERRFPFDPVTEQPKQIAGSKRKRIEFVPESETQDYPVVARAPPSSRIRDLYLSVVFPEASETRSQNSRVSNYLEASGGRAVAAEGPTSYRAESTTNTKSAETTNERKKDPMKDAICHTCGIEFSPLGDCTPHEATLAHQLALQHSHPPSSVDRRRKGFQYLSSYGWDPDSRLGLGAQGGGRLDPVRAKLKESRSGIGVDEAVLKAERRARQQVERERKERMKQEAKGLKRREKIEKLSKGKKMEHLMFGRDVVNKYLGIEL